MLIFLPNPAWLSTLEPNQFILSFSQSEWWNLCLPNERERTPCTVQCVQSSLCCQLLCAPASSTNWIRFTRTNLPTASCSGLDSALRALTPELCCSVFLCSTCSSRYDMNHHPQQGRLTASSKTGVWSAMGVSTSHPVSLGHLFRLLDWKQPGQFSNTLCQQA